MRGSGLPALLLLPFPAGLALAADQTAITKHISASSGPWAVTLSVNQAHPYGRSPRAPVKFDASDGFAFQPGDVLTIQYDSGLWCRSTTVSAGTCVDANGYSIHPANNQPHAATGVFAPSKYMDPTSYPIYEMQLVGTFADSLGWIVGMPFKVGNGPLHATIPPGAVQLQLGANLYDYSSARDYFSSAPMKVTVRGTAMRSAGSMPQLAAGGLWKTTIVLENPASRPAQARLNFYDNNGNALPLPLSFPETPAAAPVVMPALDRTLGPGAALTIVVTGPESAPAQVGWAQLVADGNVTGFAVFGAKAGNWDQEAVVPLETRNAETYIVWFDNTASRVAGVALANVFPQSVTVEVTARDESGVVIGSGVLALPALGHTSFELPQRFPETAQKRGTMEFRASSGGRISVLGLRFNPVAFTSIPVAAR